MNEIRNSKWPGPCGPDHGWSFKRLSETCADGPDDLPAVTLVKEETGAVGREVVFLVEDVVDVETQLEVLGQMVFGRKVRDDVRRNRLAVDEVARRCVRIHRCRVGLATVTLAFVLERRTHRELVGD